MSSRTYIRLALGVALVTAVVGAPTLASAQPQSRICVQVDTRRDTLEPKEQHAARLMVLQQFQKEGFGVDLDNASCSEVYYLYHLQLGKTLTIYVTGPRGTRQARSSSVDELPLHYSQIVKSLITGEPLTNDSAAVDRNNATADQMAPRRVGADSLKYVRIGFGAIKGDGVHQGPALGIGYRYELDRIGIDISVFNFMAVSDGGSGVNGSWIRLMILNFLEPTKGSSSYFGAGLSWGGTALDFGNGNVEAGSGIQGELSVGHEMLRASTIRVFVEGTATLPFYKTGSRYTPSFVVSLGLGWGKSNAVRVVK